MKTRISTQRLGLSVAGFLLGEALIYIALLTLISGFAFAAFFKGLSISQDLKRNTNGIARTLQTGEQWRSDIRTASGPLVLVREEGAVALEIPGEHGVTVYLFHNRGVWRRSGGGRWREVLPQVKISEMKREQRKHAVCWSWDIELMTRKQLVRVPPLFSFRAVEPLTATQ